MQEGFDWMDQLNVQENLIIIFRSLSRKREIYYFG